VSFKKISLIVGLFLVLGITIFGISNNGLFVLSDNVDSIKLGVSLALSGDGASFGEFELKAIKLAVKDFQLKHDLVVDLFVEDMMTDNKSSILSVQKLITLDKVEGIIGTTWLDTFQGAAEFSNKNNVVMISPSGFINAIKMDENYDYVFSTFFRNDLEMRQIIDFFQNKNYKNIVIFYEENPFWQMLSEELVVYAKQKEIEVVSYGFVPNTIDFRTQIFEAKKTNSDAVFFGFDKEQSILSFAKQIKEIFPESKVFSNETPGSLVFQNNYAELFEGFSYIFPVDADEKFIEKYFLEYDEMPGVSAANAYDATNILLESILKSKNDNESILDIVKYSEFDSVTFGKIGFDSIGGVKEGNFVIKQLVNKEFKEID